LPPSDYPPQLYVEIGTNPNDSGSVWRQHGGSFFEKRSAAAAACAGADRPAFWSPRNPDAWAGFLESLEVHVCKSCCCVRRVGYGFARLGVVVIGRRPEWELVIQVQSLMIAIGFVTISAPLFLLWFGPPKNQEKDDDDDWWQAIK
jgi:hypothetical protein